jgi:hypothetical protein
MNVDDPRTDWPGLEPRFDMAWRSWHVDEVRPLHDRLRAESDGHGDTPPKPSGHSSNGNGAAPGISDDRVTALRRWIAEGGHNDPEVAEEVARRIIQRGDL